MESHRQDTAACPCAVAAKCQVDATKVSRHGLTGGVAVTLDASLWYKQDYAQAYIELTSRLQTVRITQIATI